MKLNRFRIEKELRDLAPLWPHDRVPFVLLVLCATLFLFPAWTMSEGWRGLFNGVLFCSYAFVAFPLGSLCLGKEFDEGTWVMLLAQPISRKQVWREKISALFIVLGGMFTVYIVGVLLVKGGVGIGFELTLGTMVFVYAGVGGPFFSLMTRGSRSAFWLSLVAPLLLLIVGGLLNSVFESLTGIDLLAILTFHGTVSAPTLIIPCYLLGYFLARHRFLNFQMEQPGSSHAISKYLDSLISHERTSTRRYGNKVESARRTLLGKELQLQRAPFLFALSIYAFWAVLIALPGPASEGASESLCALCIRPCVFFLLPLLIGASSVASERTMGAFGWQYSHPHSRRDQWALKVLVCLSLTAVLSGVLGVSFDRLMFGSLEPRDDHEIIPVGIRALRMSLEVVIIALYTSTLSTSTLNAFLGGFALSAFGLPQLHNMIPGSEMRVDILDKRFGAPPWFDYSAMGLMVAMLYIMAYRNFKMEQPEKGRAGNQIGTLVCVHFAWFFVHIFWGLFTSGRFAS